MTIGVSEMEKRIPRPIEAADIGPLNPDGTRNVKDGERNWMTIVFPNGGVHYIRLIPPDLDLQAEEEKVK